MEQENKKCPICTSNNLEVFYSYITLNKNLLRCKNCEVQYLDPYPTYKELNDIYSEGYVAWGSGEDDIFSSMKKEKFRSLLNDIKKYISKGKLLDVGCGPGYLLEEAKEIGFDVYGVEFGEYAANIAINKFGKDKIYNGTLEDSNFENNSFDIITMSDLLEHVMDPVNVLLKANQYLCSSQNIHGGYIVITTPYTNSLTCTFMKKNWPHYNLEHIHYFNKKSIKELATKTGFEIIDIKPFFKILTIKYMYNIFYHNNRKILSTIFNILSRIPILGNLKIPILIGEFFIVLKKVKDL